MNDQDNAVRASESGVAMDCTIKMTRIRLGCVQWQMRETNSVEDLLKQAEFFVRTLSGYNCDLALFPEFFTAPLMGMAGTGNALEAIRFLASQTPRIRDTMAELAVRHNINIVAGSMPLVENSTLYNVAWLCRRDGTLDAQYKLHPTPNEKDAWHMAGGNALQVFDTDAGRIGILICYDVEFPELARLLNEKHMQILLVPFWTDTKSGYLRVRLCAQARAIENECYVAIAGSCGNLTGVPNVDIQYSQSAVFSPSDFPFPQDAILAEAPVNTEMPLIVELDLGKLDDLRKEGSVRNGLDRRRDLYRVAWTGEE